jgi:hypothetical protein
MLCRKKVLFKRSLGVKILAPSFIRDKNLHTYTNLCVCV